MTGVDAVDTTFLDCEKRHIVVYGAANHSVGCGILCMSLC